jgi:predicted nucleic acid-binding protein
MKEPVFMDSGFWIALMDRRDQNHLTARNALKILLQNYRICLSDFIIFETLTYLNCSLKRHDLSLNFLKKTESPGISALIVDESVKNLAIEWFKRFPDTDLSVTDCTSFVLMKSRKIQWYAGFDDHFDQMGFIRVFSQLP